MAGRQRVPGAPKSVAGRVLLILRALQGQPELTLSEISDAAGLPRSTTFRLLTELHDGGLLSRDADKRFRPGPLLTALATGSRSSRSR